MLSMTMRSLSADSDEIDSARVGVVQGREPAEARITYTSLARPHGSRGHNSGYLTWRYMADPTTQRTSHIMLHEEEALMDELSARARAMILLKIACSTGVRAQAFAILDGCAAISEDTAAVDWARVQRELETLLETVRLQQT